MEKKANKRSFTTQTDNVNVSGYFYSLGNIAKYNAGMRNDENTFGS